MRHNHFTTALKKALKELRVTQAAFAAESGLSTSQVSKMLREPGGRSSSYAAVFAWFRDRVSWQDHPDMLLDLANGYIKDTLAAVGLASSLFQVAFEGQLARKVEEVIAGQGIRMTSSGCAARWRTEHARMVASSGC